MKKKKKKKNTMNRPDIFFKTDLKAIFKEVEKFGISISEE